MHYTPGHLQSPFSAKILTDLAFKRSANQIHYPAPCNLTDQAFKRSTLNICNASHTNVFKNNATTIFGYLTI